MLCWSLPLDCFQLEGHGNLLVGSDNEAEREEWLTNIRAGKSP